jgi:transcriptional antiterminator NusG
VTAGQAARRVALAIAAGGTVHVNETPREGEPDQSGLSTPEGSAAALPPVGAVAPAPRAEDGLPVAGANGAAQPRSDAVPTELGPEGTTSTGATAETPTADTPMGATPTLPADDEGIGLDLRDEPAGSAPAEPPAPAPPAPSPPPKRWLPQPTGNRDWYILKVQSNREDSIREGLLRRVAIEGLDGFFGEVIVPIEMVSEFKNGKKRVVKRKLYPGYIVVNMEINDETWHLVRSTPGIGDFVGAAGKPTPMLPHEVDRIRAKQEEKTDEAPKLRISFAPGDRVKITEGTFENFEGAVESIDEANGRVTVMINIFGRSTPVELLYWQIEGV